MKAVLIFITLFGFVFGDMLGNVENLKGIVKVKHKNSIKKQKIKKGYEIQDGDVISTYSNSFAKIKLKDNSIVMLDKKSIICFASQDKIKQDSGKVFYKITSRDAKNSLKISTDFAIIGIKGTTFIINSSDEQKSISLKEGLIGIKSTKDAFELYNQKMQADFEAFLQQQQEAFEDFKNIQAPGFVKKTKEFDLQENKKVSFKGNMASQSKWSKDDEVEFERFEKLMIKLANRYEK